MWAARRALAKGQPGFFSPRNPLPMAGFGKQNPNVVGYYDTAALKGSPLKIADFDRINDGDIRDSEPLPPPPHCSRSVREHRVPTVRGGAPAGVLRPDVFILRTVSGEKIFNEQLFPGSDRPERMDENPSLILDSLAVRLTGVIEPARTIAATAAVDHPPIRQPEKERMSFDAFTPVTAHRISPRGDFTLVLKHTLARREGTHGEHAFAVNWRPPDNHAPHTLSFPDVSASIRAANFCIQCDEMSAHLRHSGTDGHIEAEVARYVIRWLPGMDDQSAREDIQLQKS